MAGAEKVEDYEILPHQLLQDLKSEVELLKKKLSQPDSKANELILEIESLKDSTHELQAVFQKALEDAKGEEIGLTIKKLNESVANVVSQNETIARALIAISDKLDNFMGGAKQEQRVSSAAMQHTMGVPSMPGPSRMAPPPMIGPMTPSMMPPGMSGPSSMPSGPAPMPSLSPPPPPGMGKRRGIFR